MGCIPSCRWGRASTHQSCFSAADDIDFHELAFETARYRCGAGVGGTNKTMTRHGLQGRGGAARAMAACARGLEGTPKPRRSSQKRMEQLRVNRFAC